MKPFRIASRALVLALSLLSYKGMGQEVLLSDLDLTDSLRLPSHIAENQIPMDTPVEVFLESSDRGIKLSTYGKIWRGVKDNSPEDLRIPLADLFVSGLKDDDVDGYVSNRLTLPPFEKELFSEESQRTILDVGRQNMSTTDYMRVLAIAELDDPDLDLDAIITKGEENVSSDPSEVLATTTFGVSIYEQSGHWNALVVQARRGDREALERVLSYIRGADMRILSRPQISEDLAFIRQPESIDVLVEFLFTDFPSERGVFNGDTGMLPISHRAAKALAIALADYPMGYWDHYGFEQVQQMREFISNYEGPWKIIGKWNPEEATPGTKSITLASTEIEDRVPETNPEIDSSPPTIHEESHAEPSEKKAPRSLWPWIVGALILCTALGLVLSRKKS